MVMNEEEVREHCVKLAEECYKLKATVKDTDKALWDVSKALKGAQIKEELLLDYIDNMCGMIESETPLKEHDKWLEDCIRLGFYEPFPRPKAKINNCVYCDKVNIISSHFKRYVCDDCYDKNQEEKK